VPRRAAYLLVATLAAAAVIAMSLRFARTPAPRVERPAPEQGRAAPSTAEPKSPVRFETADAGIDFRDFNSPDPATPGARMFEFTGGGVGAFDYDADGRPDLHFTQGCRWPPDPDQREHLDRLFRNLGDRFIDVTDSANLVEPGFSQGPACGDFDGDGFADLYVANIGPNRLFRNNGDGTFTDVTAPSGLSAGPLADAWTASAAVADFNRDGLPDLFDVTYVEGDDVYDRICDHDGVPRVCSPTVFHGQPDRLLLNRGDGTFTDVSTIAGIDAPDGTGLGILVADFDDSGRLSVFVANDERPNHFYGNETPTPGDLPSFRECAVETGLAFDRNGHALACMGVAAGDADADGRLDLFVTNYVDEFNTLYRRRPDGTFEDDTRPAGLAEPSLKMLGFGTQFLDADLDGHEDLVVANGHIDDFTHAGYAYRMRPQFFHNLGGRFTEVPADATGPYFSRELLGRGLARLDWNGDGRDDFAVSHLDDPAALLTNVSEPAGKSASFCLVATRSARDAIGTIVTVRAAGRSVVKQLTAGDGYAASNERKLIFGLGDADGVDSVAVRWPSGATETFSASADGTEWLIVEGRDRTLRLTTR